MAESTLTEALIELWPPSVYCDVTVLTLMSEGVKKTGKTVCCTLKNADFIVPSNKLQGNQKNKCMFSDGVY